MPFHKQEALRDGYKEVYKDSERALFVVCLSFFAVDWPKFQEYAKNRNQAELRTFFRAFYTQKTALILRFAA